MVSSRSLVALVVLLGATAGCSGSSSPGGPAASGGSGASSGGGGSSAGGTSGGSGEVTGGSSGNGGTAGGSGGSAPADASPPAQTTDAGTPPVVVGPPPFTGGSTTPPAPGAYGGVGETPFVPLTYTTTPVPPLIAPACPENLLEGFSEYQAAFKVQRPVNLPASDRFEYKDGIYTFWVQSNDQSHAVGNGTAPRTEARYEDFSSGEHMWSADMMYEHVDKTCIMQIHNVEGAYATYLRITGDMMFDLASRKTVITGYVNKWFNIKVVFNTQSLDVRVYIDNCLKWSGKSPKGPTPNWYFKHGVYTCESGTCKSHYKNIHLYKK